MEDKNETQVRVAVYFRYSTDKKAQKDNSEARQKSELLEECLKRNWRVVWNDGDKATSGDAQIKPKLEELKEKIRTKEIVADALYISSWDRLTRKDSLNYAEDVKWLRDAGMKLAIKDKDSNLVRLDDNQQLMMFQMEVYAANQYLKDLSAKVRSGQVNRFNSKRLGYARIPFGFDRTEAMGDVGAGITPNQDIDLVPAIFKQALKKNVQSCVEILRKSQTYKQKKSEPTANVVKAILRNPIYISRRTFGVAGVGKHGTIKGVKTKSTYNLNRLKNSPFTTDVSDLVAPVVEEELFFKIQDKLDENSKLWSNGQRKNNQKKKYRHAGLLRCSHCGAKLIAEKKTRHVNYVCPQSKSSRLRCSGGRKTIREQEITTLLKRWEDDTWDDLEFHRHNFRQAVLAYKKFKRQNEGVKQSEMNILAGKKARRDEMARRMLEMDITDSGMEMLNEINAEITAEDARLREKMEGVDFEWLRELMDEDSAALVDKIMSTEDDRELLTHWTKLIFVLAIECVETIEPEEPNVVKLDVQTFFDLNFRTQQFKALRRNHRPELKRLINEGDITFSHNGKRNVVNSISFQLRGVLRNSDIHISVDTSFKRSATLCRTT